MLFIKFYLIVLVPNLKCTDDQSDHIDKFIRDLYWELVIFLG